MFKAVFAVPGFYILEYQLVVREIILLLKKSC